MAKHGYFFDLDGTLANTLESNAGAYAQAIKDVLEAGNKVPYDDLRVRIAQGRHYKDFLQELIPGISGSAMDQISKRKAQLYPEFIDQSTLNEELVAQIKEWKRSPDAIIALVTTAKEANARNVLRFHGIEDLFDVLVFGDGIERLKPYPDIYLKALELAGVRAENARAFEDSDAGIASAEAAGIPTTRITWASER